MPRCLGFHVLMFAALGLVACGGSGDRGGDRGPALFDPERIVEVALYLEEADWDLIREQERSILDIFGVGCLLGPFADPFTYVPANVTVDGILFENVGLRKKGFLGSLDRQKPSLKIKLDEFVQGQEHQGFERLTLNNNKQDPSHVHQCLGYDLFRAAGVPAPRCNFARVTVNGNYLGIYSHVESVKKNFLRRYFDDDEGYLYEGTLSDFREGWTATFEKKTNKEEPMGPDIAQLTAVLELSDLQLVDALEGMVDLDSFYSFWATEVLVSHWDGYANNTNNFYVYHDPGSDVFHFIPWGIDNILNRGEEHPELSSVFATGHLARRLYLLPQTRDDYLARLNALLDTIWDEEYLLAELDRMETLIRPHVLKDMDEGIAAVRSFVVNRRQQIKTELADGPPVWSQAPRDIFCFEQIGDLQVTFSTTWGSLDREDPFVAGSGTISGLVGDWQIETVEVGAVSGFDVDEEGKENAVILLLGLLPDDTFALVWCVVPVDRFGPGEFEIDWANTMVALAHYKPATEENRMIAVLGGGSIVLDQAGARNGDPVSGQISGPLVSFPF